MFSVNKMKGRSFELRLEDERFYLRTGPPDCPEWIVICDRPRWLRRFLFWIKKFLPDDHDQSDE